MFVMMNIVNFFYYWKVSIQSFIYLLVFYVVVSFSFDLMAGCCLGHMLNLLLKSTIKLIERDINQGDCLHVFIVFLGSMSGEAEKL